MMRIAVLISGSGTNLQSLIDAFPENIVLVIANKADAYGLVRAQNAGIETKIIDHRDFPDRVAFDRDISTHLRAANIDLICLAGFMRILSDEFAQEWHDKLLNIHPSLLPDFKGTNTHQRVLDSGKTETGCTVHFVRAALDDGPIIVQGVVPVLAGDDANILGNRVKKMEHHVYPLAVRLVMEKKLTIENEKVHIKRMDHPGGLRIQMEDIA